MRTEELSLDGCKVQDWSYVAEGGANLVVAYNDKTGSKSPFVGTVLRLRKLAHDAPTSEPLTLTEEDASVAFTDRVIIPLLPPNSTPTLLSIPVSREWLEDMHRHIQPHRPQTRRLVDKIDTDRSYVVLADNLVGSSSDDYRQISVEIKPKWGFLPNPDHLSEASKEIKTRYCRFCLHRLHREHGEASASHHNSQATDYCPLDLYSQQEDRVERAVRALVASWRGTNGKGNNLKIFVEGQMIFPDEVPQGIFENNDVETYLVAKLVPFLTSSNLVKHLSRLQAKLDYLDVEGLQSVVGKQTGVNLAHLDGPALERLGGEVKLQEYESFVAKYKACATTCSPDAAKDSSSGLTPLDENQPARDLIIGHLLSAAFKDCSMFVRIRSPSASSSVASSDGHEDIQAFLVDCDIKTLDRLSKYVKMDRQFVETARRILASGGRLKTCGSRGDSEATS